jgi:hypothetical protein
MENKKVKILIMFWVLLLGHCLAGTDADNDRKLLSDIPSPTSENLRWLVPADGWRYIPQHLLKGQFFRISVPETSSNPTKFKIYKISKLDGQPSIEIQNDNIYLNGKVACDRSRSTYERKRVITKELFECAHASCKSLSTKDSFVHHQSNLHLDSTYLLNAEKYNSECPIKINYHAKMMAWSRKDSDSLYDVLKIGRNTDRGYNYYFKSEGIAKDNSYIEVLVNGEKHYLDIRFCKEDPGNCTNVDVKFSDYEKDWIELKKHQQSKDLDVLNILISELKPCVEKRDVACVKMFFPNKEKDDYLLEWYEGYEIPTITIDDHFIKELNACLDYKNLLPHLYGSRGVEKVCIFQEIGTKKIQDKSDRKKAKLINITYPEAVRVRQGYPIYLKP